MAYITLEELKKILPGILDQWIDEDDESWEWIFQEIEQKCYIGGTEQKNKKGKKWKKAIENSIDDLNQRVSDFIKDYGADVRMSKEKIETLGNRYTNLTNRVNLISKNVNEAKSMAETAKRRTEVDYSKYSGKSVEKVCSTCKHAVPMDAAHECPYLNDCCPNNMSHWEAKENE